MLFSFDPDARGEYVEELAISYDSGEQCFAQLQGAAAEVDVALERSLQILDPCYISLVSQKTLRLYNRSDIRVQFEWKQLASEGHEAQRRNERAMALFSEGGAEETHATRQARIAIEEDPLVFDDPIFAIEPLSGEIFPGCSSEVTAIFRTLTLALALTT